MRQLCRASNSMLTAIAVLIVIGIVIRPVMIVAFILSLIVALSERDEYRVIGLLIFLFPFAYIFKLSRESVSLFTFLMLIVLAVMLVKRRSVDKQFFIVWVLYSVYVISGQGSISDLIKQIMIPVLIYIAMLPENRCHAIEYAKLYISSILAVSFLGYFKNYIPNMSSMIVYKAENLGYGQQLERFSGVWGDPNYYSVNLILAFTITIILHLKKRINPILAFGIYGLLTLFGALTGSKSFLLMVALAYIWLIIEAFKHKRFIFGTILLLASAIAVSFILSGRIGLFDSVLLRISRANSINELSTGRIGLWKMYIDAFFSDPLKMLFGNGMEKMFTYTTPHNTYLDYIDVFGIIGSTLFAMTIYYTTRKSEKTQGIIYKLPFWVLIIMFFSLSMLRYLDLSYQLLLAIVFMYYHEGGNQLYEDY